MKNKSTPSTILVIFLAHLLISVCFSAPAETLMNEVSPMVGTLPLLQQMCLAAFLRIDLHVHVSLLTGFSSPVVQVVRSAPSPVIVANAAAALSLTNFLNICVRLNALIRVNPTLLTILTTHSFSFARVLNRFFAGVGHVSGEAKSIVDCRTAPNFPAALAAAGLSFLHPAVIQFALLVNISLIFMHSFQTVLFSLLPALARVIAQVIILVNQILITVSALLTNILSTVIGLVGGLLGGLLRGLLFPSTVQIVGIVFPGLPTYCPPQVLGQLRPFSTHSFPIAVGQASKVYEMLNSAT